MAGNDDKRVVGPSAPTMGPLIPPTDFGKIATKIKDIVLPPTTSVGTQGGKYGEMLDGINNKLGNKKLDAIVPPTDPLLQSSSYNDAQLTAIGKKLRKAGYPVKALASDVLDLLNSDRVLIGIQAKSPTYGEFIANLTKDYLPGLDKSADDGPALPTKTVSQYDPIVLGNFVNTIYQNTLGRNATAEESDASLKKLKKMIDAGTVSTTKVVDGQNVVTSTPGFSQERGEQEIVQGIETATTGPVVQDLREKQSLDFMDFLNGLKG